MYINVVVALGLGVAGRYQGRVSSFPALLKKKINRLFYHISAVLSLLSLSIVSTDGVYNR